MKPIDLHSKIELKLPSYGETPQPVRDWFVIVSIALILLVLSVGWNMWLFGQALHGGIPGQSAVESETYDLSSLDKVRAVFEKRGAEEGRYRTEYRFVDPSL